MAYLSLTKQLFLTYNEMTQKYSSINFSKLVAFGNVGFFQCFDNTKNAIKTSPIIAISKIIVSSEKKTE